MAEKPSGVLTAPSKASPATVIADALGRSAAELKVERSVPGADGITHVRVSQEAGGLRVYGAYARAAVRPDGSLVHVIDALVAQQPVAAHTSDAADALRAALSHHGYTALVLREQGRAGQVTTFEASEELYSAPTVERVAFADAAGHLQPGYLVETWGADDNALHHTLVNDFGQVVKAELRTNQDSYRVFVEDPAKGPQVIVQGPGAGNAESPAGWLSGSQLTWNIKGNNVNTYLDVDKNNRADRGGVAVSTGDFLAVADFSVAPSTTTNRDVAVQNLFFLNNVIHDTLYRHGFTEAAGNFQVNNFGKGGAGNDAVQAEAQDGSGTDNANFATPPDGQAPRMQMYLWSGSGATHEVVAGGATYGAYGAGFGAALTTAGLSGPTVVYDDATGDAADGCEASKASLAGKVALVNRGTCSFTVKVLNAQTAGATGVIVVNNVAGAPFTMGGTDRKVKISSVMVSDVDGAALKALAGTSATLRKRATQPQMIDGDLDSDIVFHEFGHGLTWRMIGSMSGPLAGAIGEGASDTVAFLVNGDDLVGEYAYGGGIRRYPYAGYPLTYKNVTGAEVHDDGEIYAAAMWRLRELFLANGLSTDVLFTLFVDGMNYTPATPKFEDMRDGMLAASNARFGGAYNCLIWTAFAQYGIGEGARGTVVSSTSVTVVESKVVPAGVCP